MSIASRIYSWFWGSYDLTNDDQLDIVFKMIDGSYVIFEMPSGLTQKARVQIVDDVMNAISDNDPLPPLNDGHGSYISVMPGQVQSVAFNGPWMGGEQDLEPEPSPEVKAAVQDQFEQMARRVFGDKLYDGPLDENGAPVNRAGHTSLADEDEPEEMPGGDEFIKRYGSPTYTVRVEPQPGLSPEEHARVQAEIDRVNPSTASAEQLAAMSDDEWADAEREIDRREGTR